MLVKQGESVKYKLPGVYDIHTFLSLLQTYVHNRFPGEGVYVPVVRDVFSKKFGSGTDSLDFSVWDSPGSRDYGRLRPLSYHKTDLFCICFSIVDHESFDEVKSFWLPEIESHTMPQTRILLIGLKTDLRDDPKTIESLQKNNLEPLSYEDGCILSQEIDAIGYLECSAQNEENCDSIFEEVYNFFLDGKKHANDPLYNIHDYSISVLKSRAKSARK